MAVLLALLSSLMWGTSDFVGGVTSKRMPAAAVYGLAQTVGLAGLVVAVVVTGSWSTDPTVWLWAVLSGLGGLVGILAFYSALAIGPMGIVAPLVSLSAVVPVVVGLVRGEEPVLLQIFGIIVALVGIALASGPELSSPASARPLVLAIVAAGAFGAMYVTMALGSAHGPLMTMTGMRVTAVAVLGAVAMWCRTLGGPHRRDVLPLVSIGVLDTGANVAYGFASTTGLLATTAVLASLYPVVTAVLAGVLLRERLRGVQYAGVGATVVGVVLISAG